MKLLPVSEVYAPQDGHRLEDIPVDPDSNYDKWGYTIAYEKDDSGNNVPHWGNTAIFRIPVGGMTEPEYVTKPTHTATFTVSVESGAGTMVLATSSGDVREIELKEGEEVKITPGQAYFYLNNGDKDLVLHDVATPEFKKGDDAELAVSLIPEKSPRLLKESSYCFVNAFNGQIKGVILPNRFFGLIYEAINPEPAEENI